MSESKKFLFHVQGMHCKACVMMIENELQDVPGVTKAEVSLTKNIVEVTGEFGAETQEETMKKFNEVLKQHKYVLSLEKQAHEAKWSDFKIALPAALAFVAFFVLLQKLGIVNLINANEVGYGTAFVVGLVASVSTCMAVVGGLVLSMSASFAKENDKVRPQVLFHIGRIVSFFVLGGVIGALGSIFRLGSVGTFALSTVVALVLLILGINLLDVFPWAKKFQPTMPNFIGKHVQGLKNLNHMVTPALIGAATFFLPCGFTQSMQMYALTTGSFMTGALIMLAFALGTLPVLALLSFGSLGIRTPRQSSIFFKATGLVVMFFGIFNLINALVAFGIIQPVFNW
jgi:sulfite exporter TauE/SafE/copper chaperone CopZ